MDLSRDSNRKPASYPSHKEANNEYHKLIKESISFVSYSKYIAFNLEGLNRHLRRVASKIQIIQSDDSHQYDSLLVDLENVILQLSSYSSILIGDNKDESAINSNRDDNKLVTRFKNTSV